MSVCCIPHACHGGINVKQINETILQYGWVLKGHCLPSEPAWPDHVTPEFLLEEFLTEGWEKPVQIPKCFSNLLLYSPHYSLFLLLVS